MLKKSFLIIIFLIVSLFIFEKLYDFFSVQNLNIKSSYIAKGGLSNDALILGSSNAALMFYTKTFEKLTGISSYNLATYHSSFAENYALLVMYCQNNPPPKYLFINICLPDMMLSESAFHSYLFTPFSENPTINNLIKEYDNDFYDWIKIPFIKYAYFNEYSNFIAFQGLLHWFNEKQKPYFEDGTYNYNFKLNDEVFVSYEKFKTENPNGIDYRWSNESRQELILILGFAKENNIRAIVYESPFWDDVNNYFHKRNEHLKLIENIANTHHSEFWSFDTLSITKEKKYFASAFHTNSKGTEILTTRMAEVFKIKDKKK